MAQTSYFASFPAMSIVCARPVCRIMKTPPVRLSFNKTKTYRGIGFTIFFPFCVVFLTEYTNFMINQLFYKINSNKAIFQLKNYLNIALLLTYIILSYIYLIIKQKFPVQIPSFHSIILIHPLQSTCRKEKKRI